MTTNYGRKNPRSLQRHHNSASKTEHKDAFASEKYPASTEVDLLEIKGVLKVNLRYKHWHFSQIGNRHIEVRT